MWKCGREKYPVVILPKFQLQLNLGIFYVPQIYNMGPTALLPLRRKACWGFFRPKNPTASAGFEPADLGNKSQHSSPRPPKPYMCMCGVCVCVCVFILTLTHTHTYTYPYEFQEELGGYLWSISTTLHFLHILNLKYEENFIVFLP